VAFERKNKYNRLKATADACPQKLLVLHRRKSQAAGVF